ncbi:MAG: hypothetical protein HOO98_09855 [Nitrospira sp.]|nr:hypothetical protein [Nitrospira sp.]
MNTGIGESITIPQLMRLPYCQPELHSVGAEGPYRGRGQSKDMSRFTEAHGGS